MNRFLLLLTLGALLSCPSHAQSTDSPTPPPTDGPPGGHHHEMNFLTDAEKQELQTAHKDAVTANPSLAAEGKDLMEQMKAARASGTKPSEDLVAKMHAFREKMDAAMIAADANVAPILAKIKAHHHGGPDGSDGPPPASGT